MNVTVFGANGMLGRYVCKHLESQGHSVRPMTRKDLNVGLGFVMEPTLKIFLKDDDVVVNCAGIIKQRKDVSVVEMIRVNSIFPHELAAVCEEIGVELIHITTDCVYSGVWVRTESYSESAIHDAADHYGKSKSLGEPENACVIRTSIVGEKPGDQNSLLEWAKSQKGKEIEGWETHLWNGVTCLQLAKIIEEIVSKDLYWQGVRHIHSPDYVDKFQLLHCINSVYDLGMFIKRVRKYPCCNRRLASEHTISLDIPTILDQIQQQKEYGLE